jgi:CTP:phosphocholine cytidylyltransferase-like protein
MEYCCAIPLSRLRGFKYWQQNADKSKLQQRQFLTNHIVIDDDIVYLNKHYTVSISPFPDSAIIFNNITDEWCRFCNDNFDIDSVS